MENHNGGIFHASDYLLQKLDNSQHGFLKDLGVEETEAFIKYNFAPPSLRRNIGVLGLLQKRILGLSHPVFQDLLPYHVDVFGSLRPGEHDKQLYGHILNIQYQQALYGRSIFPMVYVYNRLPQDVVDQKSVASFQICLICMARKACEDGNPKWASYFSCRV